MTRRVKPKRAGRLGAKRFPMSTLRELVRDRRVWAALGVVLAPEDGSDHYELIVEDGKVVDILIEVELAPSKVEATCRLSGIGAAAGVFSIPNVGDEVLVHVADGMVDFMPAVVGVLARAGVLEDGDQAPAPGRVVIVGTQVYIHDGAGGAEPLVRKSDFDGHTHGPGSFTTPAAGGGGGPVTGTSAGAANVDGTGVLMGK